MKAFIKHTFYFISFLLGLIIIIAGSTSYLEKKHIDFNLAGNPKHIIVGHSHSECAFNDSLISSFKNLSQAGEPYFYNYIKTKYIIKQNPSIKVVFIEYTNNQINEDINEWIWGREFISNSYPIHSSYMNVTENIYLLKNSPSNYAKALSLSIRERLVMILKNDFSRPSQFGSYRYLERDKTDSLVNSMNHLNHKPKTIDKAISEANLSYLDALIEFCENNDKKVILIRSPQHKKYPGFRNEKQYLKLLETRYSNIDYLDFSNFPLSNSEFGDLQHLNYKGAKIFSQWFNSILNNGLLEKTNKQKFIDEVINNL